MENTETIKSIGKEALKDFEKVSSYQEVENFRIKYLGRKGILSNLFDKLKELPKEEKPQFGKELNLLKKELEEKYELLRQKFPKPKEFELKDDLTLPGIKPRIGSKHIVTKTLDEIKEIFKSFGFVIAEGPELETDYYNFSALNFPEDHPARDMQDTFFVEDRYVLRTHTSPIQIHALESEPLPLRVIGTGPVFRCDHDISHLPHFHQLEALFVDKKVSMADLKGTISYFVRSFFEKELKVRFRPSYFPFTEPSAEVDCQCPICHGKGCTLCKGSGWIEIGGCGLVNPRVFEQVKIDPQSWQGFAFGFGIERMAMILYRIDDIRLFPENDPRFLRQFERLTL